MVRRIARVLRAKRPWRVMAAPRPLDILEIVRETNSDLGIELLCLAQQVRLYADCHPDKRHRVFPTEAIPLHVAERRAEALKAAPADLRGDLRTLMRMRSRQPPPLADLAAACEAITLWAQEAGYSMTAVHFAEAGAMIRPNEPYGAFIAGRTNRMVGLDWRAEAFYLRAIRYAFRQQNWHVYIRAHLGLGRLLQDRGRVRAAASHLFSAARAADDQGIDWLAGQTYHDLLVLYYEAGDYPTAAVYAEKALAIYPMHHERYPIAVHDFGFLLVVCNRPADALPLLEPLVRTPLSRHDQVLAWGTMARTAGALGLIDRYSDAETRILDLAPQYDSHAPFAFVNLAFGARALGDWELADRYARTGLSLAEEKNRPHDAGVARELLS